MAARPPSIGAKTIATVQPPELVEFHEYPGKHLHDPQPHRTPEDLLEEWRMRRGNIAGEADDVTAVRAALRDMDAGEVDLDTREFLGELDAEIQQRMET